MTTTGMRREDGTSLPPAAIRSVEETWLRILRRRHPDITWTIRPRCESNTDTTTRHINGPHTSRNQQDSINEAA